MRAIRRLVYRRADKRGRIRDCDANTYSNCARVIRMHHRKCDRKICAEGLYLHQERRRESTVAGGVGSEAGIGRAGCRR